MINTLIFDLDMTLIDSLEAITLGCNLLARHFGLEEKTEDIVLKHISMPIKEFWTKMWGQYRPEFEEYFMREILPLAIGHTKVYPETEALLSAAKNKGYLLGVATNRTNPWHDLVTMNLAKFFDTAVGANDVAQGKPDPAMLLAVIKQLGVSPTSAIFIGDSTYDMNASKAAGIKGLGLEQGGASPETLQAAGAWMVRPNLASLNDILNI